MSEITVEQALQIALGHQHAGQLQEAQDVYRQILQAYPDQPDALHLLGLTLHQAGQDAEAETHIQKAISVAPRELSFRLSLGVVYQSMKQMDDAMAQYQAAITADPNFADAYNHLGVAQSILGRFDLAVETFTQLLKIKPNDPPTQSNLGIALCHLGRYDEAIWVLRAAVTQMPKVPDFHACLGAALYRSGQFEAATAACREAVRLDPNHGQAHQNLSMALAELGQYLEAAEEARKAAAAIPQILDVQLTLGESLRKIGRFDEAIAVYKNAITQHPRAAELYNNLGNILKDTGQLDEAIATFRQALKFRPDAASVYSNLVYTMQYHPDISQEALFEEHRAFNRIYAEPLERVALPHNNDADPNRRLKVGYISSEFRTHALGNYLAPLLANHDKSAFEIFCYADVAKPDGATFRLKTFADHWIDIRGKTDEQVAQRIRLDAIDILIDLHQHMGGNRILIYARKPAPVQIGFAGYPATTGLTSIEWRLTDKYLEPLDLAPIPTSEKPWRLPDTFWCYGGLVGEASVNPLPALANGFVTFGSLNNYCKVNDRMMANWARVMKEIPGSRMLILADEGPHRKHTIAFMQKQGIAPERMLFERVQAVQKYFELYHRIDVSLDTFPYNSHTTSLDAMWMGVPVVTLVGQTPVSRAGWSQLSNLRMTDLAATTPDDFVRVAVKLARDFPRMVDIRATLRQRMKDSPLMDARRFARNVEAAYRGAWQEWCHDRPRGGWVV